MGGLSNPFFIKLFGQFKIISYNCKTTRITIKNKENMDYQKALVKLYVSENGYDTSSQVIARVERKDVDAQKELEKCREAAIRALWLEWGVELGMSAWSTIDEFLDEMSDVVNTPREISFRTYTDDDYYSFLII